MKIKLTFKERLNFNQLMPEKGSMMEQVIVKDVMEKITPTQAENKKADAKSVTVGDRKVLTYNEEKAADKSIEFNSAELSFLKGRVSEMDKKGDITQWILTLCKKIQDSKE